MKRWRGLLLALTLGLGLATNAVQASELQAGRDFRLIEPPLAVADQGKIEVTEFFWYGCPHCFDLEPVITPWAKVLPKDVNFRRVPTIFHSRWASGARLYYTLEAMNLVEALHGEVFTAIHRERLRLLDDERALFEWAAKKGVDSKKFADAWNSFGVQARVLEAQRLTQESRISGVPALIVNGRYQALTSGNYGDLIQRADQLVARARNEAAASK